MRFTAIQRNLLQLNASKFGYCWLFRARWTLQNESPYVKSNAGAAANDAGAAETSNCVSAVTSLLSEVSALRKAGARAGEIGVLAQQQDVISIPRMQSLVTCSRLCGKCTSTLQTVKYDAAREQAVVLNLLRHCFGDHQLVKLSSNPLPLTDALPPPLSLFFPTPPVCRVAFRRLCFQDASVWFCSTARRNLPAD